MVPAVYTRSPVLKTRHVFADRRDESRRRRRPACRGGRLQGIGSRPDIRFYRVHAGSMDADDNLTRPGRGSEPPPSFIASGGPNSCKRIAFMMGSILAKAQRGAGEFQPTSSYLAG